MRPPQVDQTMKFGKRCTACCHVPGFGNALATCCTLGTSCHGGSACNATIVVSACHKPDGSSASGRSASRGGVNDNVGCTVADGAVGRVEPVARHRRPRGCVRLRL